MALRVCSLGPMFSDGFLVRCQPGHWESSESASIPGMFVPSVVQGHVISGNKLTAFGQLS